MNTQDFSSRYLYFILSEQLPITRNLAMTNIQETIPTQITINMINSPVHYLNMDGVYQFLFPGAELSNTFSIQVMFPKNCTQPADNYPAMVPILVALFTMKFPFSLILNIAEDIVDRVAVYRDMSLDCDYLHDHVIKVQVDVIHALEYVQLDYSEFFQLPNNPSFVAASEESVDGLERLVLQDDEDLMKNPPMCVVCMEVVERDVQLIRMPCSHIHHEDCIVQWLKTSHICPLCRCRLPCV